LFCPCEPKTSTCRSFATISSGLYRFLAIAVLLDVKDIPQVGPLQWGWITTNGHVRPWDSKPPQRDLTPVLHRPVEPAGAKRTTFAPVHAPSPAAFHRANARSPTLRYPVAPIPKAL